MMPPERHPNCRCEPVFLAELDEPEERPSPLVAGIDLGAGLALGFLTVLLALIVCFGLVAIGVGGYIKYKDVRDKVEMRK